MAVVVKEEELQKLFVFVVEFAQDMLQKNGEFYPFGATLALDGQVVAEAGYQGDDQPNAQDVYVAIHQRFVTAGGEGGIRAAALVANVAIPDELEAPSRDAIRVHLEAQGFARFIYVPYEATAGQALRLHDPVLVDVEPGFFGG